MGIYYCAPTPKDTQRFAEEICMDFNPVHKASNNPQYVPGDYLVLTYIDFLKKIPEVLALTFGGKRGILPNEIINFSSDAISTNEAGDVLKIEPSTPLKFEGYTLNNPFLIQKDSSLKLISIFPNFDHKTVQFAKEYSLISGDLSNGLLNQILTYEKFEKTEDTILLYRAATFELYSGFNRIKENENLERKLFDVKTNIRTNGKSGKILVSYFLINSITGNKVGVLQKDLACYNLQPK